MSRAVSGLPSTSLSLASTPVSGVAIIGAPPEKVYSSLPATGASFSGSTRMETAVSMPASTPLFAT